MEDKKQKKRTGYLAKTACFCFCCCLLLLVMAGCGKQAQEQLTERDQSLLNELISKEPQPFVVAFFPDKNSDNLIPLSFSVNATRDIVWTALEKNLAGPPNDFVGAVLPMNVKLKDVYYDENGINLFLQGEEELTAADIDVAALSSTIHYGIYEQGIDVAAPLRIFYNDQSLLDEPYYQSFVNDYSKGSEHAAYAIYSDSQAMFLVPVRLRMEYTEGEKFYQELLENWASQPPKGSGLAAVVPEGTTVLGCNILENGVLHVDLNQAAVSYGGGTARETMLIDSLIATLRPYAEIQSVKITIEGQKIDYLPEGTDLSTNLMIPHGHGRMNKIN